MSQWLFYFLYVGARWLELKVFGRILNVRAVVFENVLDLQGKFSLEILDANRIVAEIGRAHV